MLSSFLHCFPASVCHWDFEGSLVENNLADSSNRRKSFVEHWPNDFWLIRCDVLGYVITIDVLPDDVLLMIFDFYLVRYQDPDFSELYFKLHHVKRKIESWQSLVHVCRRWRGLVFGSPRRLNLQLCYIPGTSAKKSVWPALPLLVLGSYSNTMYNISQKNPNRRMARITM